MRVAIRPPDPTAAASVKVLDLFNVPSWLVRREKEEEVEEEELDVVAQQEQGRTLAQSGQRAERRCLRQRGQIPERRRLEGCL